MTALATKTGRTKTLHAKEAILEHLDDTEDKYLAINRLENPGKRWTLDEMEHFAADDAPINVSRSQLLIGPGTWS